jgi:hypothetical protein
MPMRFEAFSRRTGLDVVQIRSCNRSMWGGDHMSLAQLFSGAWIIQVVAKDGDFSERFRIEGSLAADGTYPGDLTLPPVLVTGSRWFLRFEWNNNAGSGWQPSDVRRTAASFTVQEGLVTMLGADDNFSALRDHDFNDLVLRCRNVDPAINPRIPLTTVPDFTVPGLDAKPDIGRVRVRQAGPGVFFQEADVLEFTQWDLEVTLTGKTDKPFPFTVTSSNPGSVPINALDEFQEISPPNDTAVTAMRDAVGASGEAVISVHGPRNAKTASIHVSKLA